MAALNPLLAAPPHRVEQALERLGANLRTARIRRRLTVPEVAQKIGTGVRAVYDAERSKPSTSIATYAALLWTFGLLGGFELLAEPARDSEGQTRARARAGAGSARQGSGQ